MRKNGLYKNRLPMIDGNLEFSWEFSFQNNNTIVFQNGLHKKNTTVGMKDENKGRVVQKAKVVFSFSLGEGVVCIWVSWFSLLNFLLKIMIISDLFLFGF